MAAGAALDVCVIDHLPPLSWVAHVDGARAEVTCGGGVVKHDDGVFEGAWSDAGGALSPLDASEVFGSGLCRREGEWIAIPPSHMLECLYVLRGRAWTVSNSLALLQAKTGFAFELSGAPLLKALAQGAAMIRPEPAPIPTSQGPLYLVYHHNMRLGPAPQTAPKPEAPRFSSFEHYRDYLRDTLRAVAVQSDRSFIAAVSSGYDSVACAALIAGLGGRDVLTFARARGGVDDSGAPIARALGMEAVEYGRPEHVPAHEAAHFLCMGLGGEDAVYAGFGEALSGRVFVTGFHGDKVWDLGATPNDRLRRGDLSGASLGEFRLRQNFVHAPAPFIAGRRHADLDAISRSAAMKPYRVGGGYDRPLARRMAEEAGVPRGSFGVRKKAVSLHQVGAAKAPASLQRAVSVAAWRLMHGGARRLGPARRPALAAADWLYPRIFGCPFVVLEHAAPAAAPAFTESLADMRGRYRSWLT